MTERPVTVRTLCISLLIVVLLLISLVPFASSSLRSAHATLPTAISPTGGTGSHASLGTIITSGTSTVPTPLCTANCVITGGTRAGSNLFHSFGDFNIGALDSARFQTGLVNPLPDASVSNILARITGGPSNLFGTLDSVTYYPSANLFLMNPAGFLFGPNATVNVGGMMTFTSADYLRLGEIGSNTAGIFHADPAQVSVLIASPVTAFGFLGSNPGGIIAFEGGQLTVANGAGVALVGGDINLIPDSSGTASGITAHGRPIILTSVAGPGEVAAGTGMPAPGMAFSSITLGQGTTLDTSGDSSFSNGSGGPVSIRGGQFVATGATINTKPTAGSFGSGGAVTVDVTGSATFTDSFIQTGPVPNSLAGSAGAVSVTAKDGLGITKTLIDASARNAGGDGGPVTLKTNGSLSLTDSIIGTVVDSGSTSGNGGAVTIMGKDVTFNNSGVFTDVTVSTNATSTPALGQVHPGTVTVTAENTVTFSGSPLGDPGNPVISATATGSQLDAGSVTITGKTVNLSNGTIVASMSEGKIPSPGNSGLIEIRGNNVNLSQFTLESTNAGRFASTGKGGSIFLQGLDNPRADNIQLTASTVSTQSSTEGGAGSIEFQAKALTLNNTQVIAGTFGPGRGGSITVLGAENITLQSNSAFITSAIDSGGAQGPFGSAGSILLETQQLTMQGGSGLKAADLPISQGNAGSITVRGTDGPAQSILIDGLGSGVFTNAEGNGKGGDIALNANSVTLQDGGTLSATTSGTIPTATGGSIQVNANQVQLNSEAAITANSTGGADAGNINITATNGLSMHNSSITTQANAAGGGTIKITTAPSGTVQLTNSTISASVLNGTGGGGSVNIDPQFVILLNSNILANAVQGPGGNISITTNLLLKDATSMITASSRFGENGTVTIQSPNAPASGQIQPLGATPLQATSLLNQRCASLAGGEFSSFTVARRDSLPTEPGGWLSSPLAMLSTGTGLAARGGGERPVAPGETPLLSLRQIAPAGFLTQTFAVDRSASCQS